MIEKTQIMSDDQQAIRSGQEGPSNDGGSQSLVRAKLTRPQIRAGLVQRPQLIERLNQGLSKQLTLVLAPPGYGKTTLVVQWLNQLDRPSGWLSLDALDNDLTTFVAYFLAAARTAYPDAGELTAPLFSAAQDVPPEAFADALIEDLAGLSGSLVLVLDDFYLINTPQVLTLMDRLLQFIPSNVHPVFISRAEPDIPLARLRLRAQISELRTDDLRFGPEAARRLLTDLTGIPFDFDSAATLDERAEGWVLALQLAGLTMRANETPAERVGRFSRAVDEQVASFLMEEVFARQPAPIRDFLLQTSILERFSAPLSAALAPRPPDADQPQTTEVLSRLLRSNQMITPLDDELQWFRYHRLFRQFLHARLLKTVPEQEASELHRRAAAWLARDGQINEALSHAVVAGDLEMAIGLIEDNLHPALNTENWQQLGRQLDLLPAAAQTHPSILVARGWLHLLHLHIPALAQAAAAAAMNLDAVTLTPDRRARLQTQIDILSGIAAYWAFDTQRTMALLEQSLPRLEPEMSYVRGVIGLYYGLATHVSGHSAEALHYLQAMIDGQVRSEDWLTTRLLMGQMIINADIGDIRASLQTSELLEQVARRSSIENSLAWGFYAQGYMHYELNQLPEADACLQYVLDSPHQFNAFTVYHTYLLQALILEACGRAAEAEDILRRGRDFAVSTNGLMIMPFFAAAEHQLRLSRGQTVTLAPAPTPTLTEAMADLRLPQSISTLQIRARCLIRMGTPESLREARDCLAVLQKAAVLLHLPRQQAGILAIDALALAAQGDEEAALETLRRSLALTERGQSIRLYVDCGPALAPLLEQLAAEGFMQPYVEQLLAALGSAAARQSPADLGLTRRESDVLTLMAARASNQEIAERLFLTTASVKTYSQRIFRKLGVSNRREAVSKAAEYGLI